MLYAASHQLPIIYMIVNMSTLLLNSSHSFFSLLSFSCLSLERFLFLVTYLKPFYSFNICLSFAVPEAVGPSSYLPKCLQWCHTLVPPWAASAAFNCSTCADDMPGHDVFFMQNKRSKKLFFKLSLLMSHKLISSSDDNWKCFL